MTSAPMLWEYKTAKLKLRGFVGGTIDQSDLDNLLEEAGIQGWELVSIVATNLYQGRTQDAALVFKRPKPLAPKSLPAKLPATAFQFFRITGRQWT